MNEWEDLRRSFAKVEGLTDFRPGDRIWWLYLREAVEKVLFRHKLEELSAAHLAVKAFPENLPNERAAWLRVQEAVREAIERHDRSGGTGPQTRT